MMKSILCAFVVAGSLCLAGTSDAQDLAVSKMALMTFEGDMMVQAPPAAVWSALTDADKVQSWCPLWKDAKMTKSLTAVGQTLDFMDDYGNAGKSVVIYLDPGKELRLAHVPDNGSYVCQAVIRLTPDGTGTKVHFSEQYSDAPDAPLDKDTAAQSKVEMEGYLKAFKDLAEKSAMKGKAK